MVTVVLCAALATLVGLLVVAAVARVVAVGREATVRAAVDSALAVAGDRLDARAASGARELDVRGEAIGRQLSDMGSQLRQVADLVGVLQRERAEQHGQLVRGLTETTQVTARLADTTQHLREALASPKARGQWGERMADDVLRAAGFVEGVNYRRQKATGSGTVPDFTFLLPQGVLLHMDVKFPVDNYLRHLEARTPAERDTTRAGFLRDVRARLKELSGRAYDDPATTTGFLLMFIPNESIYGFIHEHDPGLADAALTQRVVLCSPFTLFAVLAVIRQAVDSFRLERASDEILAALAGFSDQWDKFAQQLETLGTRLASVQKIYDEVSGPRRRQLERQLDAIDDIRTRRGDPAPARAGPPLRSVN